MMTFHLRGQLGKQYSSAPITLDVPDILMGMQMLAGRFGNTFKQRVRDGEWHVTKKPLKECTQFDDGLGEDEIKFGQSDGTHIYVTPKVKARGGIVRAVIGVILIVVGTYFNMPFLTKVGIALVIGGVAEMLAPKPQTGQKEQSGTNPSFMFNGTVNVTEQGGPVPVIYGRVPRASSLVLSAGMTTENLPPETNQNGA